MIHKLNIHFKKMNNVQAENYQDISNLQTYPLTLKHNAMKFKISF